MTLTVQNPSIQYTGDNVTVIFTFAFTVYASSDLKVFVDTVQLVEYSDYTLENVTPAGGEVHLFVAPSSGVKVLLIRVTPKSQQMDLEPFSEFPANTIENSFDRVVAITQELEQRFIDDVQPQVFSVFGRVGTVVADVTDYAQFYASLPDYNLHKADKDAHHNQAHAHDGIDGSGTISHVNVKDRSADFCHPTNAITGLDTKQAEQDTATAQVQTNLDTHEGDINNPHQVTHAQLGGVSPDQHHNQVHNLFGTDHADINPLPAPVIGAALIYTNIVPAKPWEALNVYTISAYGGVFQSTATALPDMIIGWTTLLADSGTFVTPRGVTQSPIQNGIRFDEAGVFSVHVSLTLTHDESNQSRQTMIRLFNVTKGTGGPTTVIGIGRNQSVTNYSFSLPAEITASDIGDLWKIEMGSGDPIQDILEVSYQFWTNGIGEYRG